MTKETAKDKQKGRKQDKGYSRADNKPAAAPRSSRPRRAAAQNASI